jgi:hypothetical protein
MSALLEHKVYKEFKAFRVMLEVLARPAHKVHKEI